MTRLWRLRDRLESRWDALDDLDRRRVHLLVLAMAVFLVHYAVYSFWYVEDAAITFGFSRHLAAGDGLVAWPGGERVEGFSNPTWTFLLAAADLVGVNPFVSGKLLGALFGLAAQALAFLWARDVFGDRRDLAPALTALFLGLSPQFVVWHAAGLENSIFNLFLAAGAWLLVREIRGVHRGLPWSGLAFALLTLSRPEAAMYAAVAGVSGALWITARRGLVAGLGWSVRWGLLLGLPVAAYVGFRYAYFAWEFPNTYYAKLVGADRFQPWKWAAKGWRYLRSYALASGQGFLLPLYVLGQTGLRGWRGIVGGVLVAVLLVLLVSGLGWLHELIAPLPTEPTWLVNVRIGFLFALFLGVARLGLGRRGAAGRVLAWDLSLAALFFTLYSGGDWMDEFRLLSMASVPMAVLLADAASMLWARERLPARIPAAVLAAVPLILGPVRTAVFLSNPETMPFDVHRQVAYEHLQADRLHIDHPSALPVDMGAHVWWAGFEIRDLPALIDVPMARHRWEKPFMHEYVFEEYRPTFAHVHGGWARKTKMFSHREFRRDYIEVDPYPVSPWSAHTGNWVRRDLFIEERERPGPAPRASFGDVDLVDWQVPSPEVAPGQALYLELVLGQLAGKKRNFRVQAFIASDEGMYLFEVPPGYDWYFPRKWKRADQVRTKHTVHLPDDLPVGSYDFGVFLLHTGPDAGVVGVTEAEDGALTERPRVAVGEVRWPDAVQVVSVDEAVAAAEADLSDLETHADAGRCDEAEHAWHLARRHLAPEHPWRGRVAPHAEGALARCWAERAATTERPEAVTAIHKAREGDHRDRRVRRVGRELGRAWDARGWELLELGDHDAAYGAWRDAMWADPTRAWTRRRAEELRDWRLELGERPRWAADLPDVEPYTEDDAMEEAMEEGVLVLVDESHDLNAPRRFGPPPVPVGPAPRAPSP